MRAIRSRECHLVSRTPPIVAVLLVVVGGGMALLGGGCAVASQELRDMKSELLVQMGKVEESIGGEAKKLRALIERRGEEDGKILRELGDGVGKSRAALEQEIKTLRDKLSELQAVVLALKKGTQTGGGSTTAAAELDIRAVGENQYRISRKQFAEYAYELSRLGAALPLVAHFEGEKRVGVRLFESNAFLGRFGILNGDVLLSVNDLTLRSPDQTRDVSRRVRKATKITVTFQREGHKQQVLILVGD